jgi:hypothetical protein
MVTSIWDLLHHAFALAYRDVTSTVLLQGPDEVEPPPWPLRKRHLVLMDECPLEDDSSAEEDVESEEPRAVAEDSASEVFVSEDPCAVVED